MRHIIDTSLPLITDQTIGYRQGTFSILGYQWVGVDNNVAIVISQEFFEYPYRDTFYSGYITYFISFIAYRVYQTGSFSSGNRTITLPRDAKLEK